MIELREKTNKQTNQQQTKEAPFLNTETSGFFFTKKKMLLQTPRNLYECFGAIYLKKSLKERSRKSIMPITLPINSFSLQH